MSYHQGDYDYAQRKKHNELVLFLMETSGALSPTARRHLRWLHRRSKGIDRKRRMELLGITLDIYTPTNHQRIVDHMDYRTYKHAQFKSLMKKVPEFEIAATYDFSYDITKPHEITTTTEDVVFILKKV